MMRNLFFVFLVLNVAATFGCWNAPAGKNTVSTTSEPGVTQPPPPDPDKVVGNNPRDPKNRKPRPDMDPSATPGATEPRPAPENSEASVMMNADGSITEFRVFKSHPQIDRVEANWTDPSNKTLKVFLKGGKKLEARTDKVPSLNTASSSLIMEIVGAKKPASNGDRPRVVGNK